MRGGSPRTAPSTRPSTAWSARASSRADGRTRSSAPVRDGRRRRFYRVTLAGEGALAQALEDAGEVALPRSAAVRVT